MVYPITERTHFTNQAEAWRFAKLISNLKHHIVSDYGTDDDGFYVETKNDPFRTKDELLKLASN